MEKTVQAWQKPEGQGLARGVKLRKDVDGPIFVFPGAGNGDARKIGVRSGAGTEAVLNSSMGAGKTSVLAEASDILALQMFTLRSTWMRSGWRTFRLKRRTTK